MLRFYNLWERCAYLKRICVIILIHSVLCMAIIALMLYFGEPFIASLLPLPWADIVTALVIIIMCAPFLWALMRLGSHSDDVITQGERMPQTFTENLTQREQQ